MKILYIITLADGGGAQRYVLQLARRFGGSIAAGDEASQLFDEAKANGLVTHQLWHLKRNISWHDFLAIPEIMRLIKKVNPDIVHLNSSKAGFLGSIAAKLCGKKVVFTAHGFYYFDRASLPVRLGYTFLEKFASLFRDRIIAVSENDARLARLHRLLPDEKIITIYNGIAPVAFINKQEARTELGLKKDAFIFGNIAHYYNRKGLDVLIEAVSLLNSQDRDNIQVVFLGDGPERKSLESLIAEKKLAQMVILAGFISEASRYLKAFDAFVLSSRREGFPYVILEALQAGLPIIATDVGGVKEALGPAGKLAPSDSPQALAEAMHQFLHNPILKEQLGMEAQSRAAEFSEEKMLEKTEKVYQKL